MRVLTVLMSRMPSMGHLRIAAVACSNMPSDDSKSACGEGVGAPRRLRGWRRRTNVTHVHLFLARLADGRRATALQDGQERGCRLHIAEGSQLLDCLHDAVVAHPHQHDQRVHVQRGHFAATKDQALALTERADASVVKLQACGVGCC